MPHLIAEPLRLAIRRLVRCDGDWPLFVHGPPGTGKTCAALALLDYAGGDYYTALSLCDTLIEAQQGRLLWYDAGHGGDISPREFCRKLARAPLLVLDELGARDRVSDHHYEAVKRAVDDREGRPLMLLSNLALAQLEKVYDDRLASRMAAGTVVELTGRDRRLPETEPKSIPRVA